MSLQWEVRLLFRKSLILRSSLTYQKYAQVNILMFLSVITCVCRVVALPPVDAHYITAIDSRINLGRISLTKFLFSFHSDSLWVSSFSGKISSRLGLPQPPSALETSKSRPTSIMKACPRVHVFSSLPDINTTCSIEASHSACQIEHLIFSHSHFSAIICSASWILHLNSWCLHRYSLLSWRPVSYSTGTLFIISHAQPRTKSYSITVTG